MRRGGRGEEDEEDEEEDKEEGRTTTRRTRRTRRRAGRGEGSTLGLRLYGLQHECIHSRLGCSLLLGDRPAQHLEADLLAQLA